MSNIAKDFWSNPEKRETIKAELTSVAQGLSNPCVLQYGTGPDGKFCGGCTHLIRTLRSKLYYTCDERRDLADSAIAGHKAHWHACARFEQVEAK